MSGTKRKQDVTKPQDGEHRRNPTSHPGKKAADQNDSQSSAFLEALHLLKEEMLAAMDRKLACLTQQTAQAVPRAGWGAMQPSQPQPWGFTPPGMAWWNPNMMHQMTSTGLTPKPPMTHMAPTQ